MNVEKMFTAIDIHVAGEAFRMIIHSPMQLRTQDIASNQSILENDYAQEKELLLNEPRGHRGINGCMVTPSSRADYAVLFVNHAGEHRFSYSGLMATLTALLETGNISEKANGLYEVETVNGIYTVRAAYVNQTVEKAGVESDDCRVIESAGEDYQLVEVDASRHYAIYSLPESIPAIEMTYLSSIMKWGKQIIAEMDAQSLHGVILMETISSGEIRSVTFEQDGAILRSPGADSTFALYTALAEKGEQPPKLNNHSIFGSQLTAVQARESAQRYSMETQAFITGEHQFLYDPDDPLERGFLLK
ncbi:proline racemase [Lentibacillus cibarius]|uniref:Proline racemase n=1 Tax=Lentibacillus cibarius TaxID=2583219 RepID=A0A549YEK8_9BACI|nr:proline racemase family protein [Lentibacillus cibarius]TMN21436.1 proline racemase [Lentibacillus cibarius]TRM10314.1 proline racemase [Lentibacillus cibarius]